MRERQRTTGHRTAPPGTFQGFHGDKLSQTPPVLARRQCQRPGRLGVRRHVAALELLHIPAKSRANRVSFFDIVSVVSCRRSALNWNNLNHFESRFHRVFVAGGGTRPPGLVGGGSVVNKGPFLLPKRCPKARGNDEHRRGKWKFSGCESRDHHSRSGNHARMGTTSPPTSPGGRGPPGRHLSHSLAASFR
jgi:hypothetical protein